jgi:hypothetical protein
LLGKSDAIVLDVVVVVALSLSLFVVVVCCVVGVVGCCGVVVVGDDVGGGRRGQGAKVHRRRCTWHRQARLKKMAKKVGEKVGARIFLYDKVWSLFSMLFLSLISIINLLHTI